MKVWIGHYYENTREWFVVWAQDKQEAWDKVDELAGPKADSLRELSSTGFINFHVDYNEENIVKFSPSKDKNRQTNWLCLGTVGFSEDPKDYIKRLYSEKESTPKLRMKVWLGNYLPKLKKDSDESFIVWAKNKQEALLHIDSATGNVDRTSLLEITEPGFINFHVACQGKQVIYSPPKEDLENDTWINIAGVFEPEGENIFEIFDEDEEVE
jgi:hypothetical protein